MLVGPVNRPTPMCSYTPSTRTTLQRLPNRGSYDKDVVHGILDESLFCTVSYVDSTSSPVAIPINFVRIGEDVFFHGKASAGFVKALGAGSPVCVNWTIVDGLVLARSAFNHSMNYRSVILFGRGEGISDPTQKKDVLRAFSDKYTPGRHPYIKGPSEAELTSTGVIRVPIVEVSAKVRSGPPQDDADDYNNPSYWAGVIPVKNYALPAIPDDRLLPGIDTPAHVRNFGVVPPLPKTPALRTQHWLLLLTSHALVALVVCLLCRRWP